MNSFIFPENGNHVGATVTPVDVCAVRPNLEDFEDLENAPPIIPGRAPSVAAPSVGDITPTVPKFSAGSLPANFQHDAYFVATALRSSNHPEYGLMPLGANSSISSAQITSVVKTSQEIVGGSSITLETDGIENPNQNILNITAGPNITAESDASGTVTISGTGSGDSRFISRPDYKRPAFWLQDQPVGGSVGVAGIISVGDISPVRTTVAGFTDANIGPTATDMPGWNFTNTTSPTSADYRVLWGMDIGYFGRDFTFTATASIVSNLGSGRYWFALSDGGVANRFLLVFHNSDDPSPNNTIGFLYSPTSPNWRAVTGNGTTTTNVDTGVAVALNTPVQLRIDWTASTNTAVFTIDGTVVATITTNTPTAVAYGMVQGVHGTNSNVVGYSGYSMYCAASYPFSSSILT